MASIITRPGGQKLVQFTKDKRRRTITLGVVSDRRAERFNERLEELLSVVALGQTIGPELQAWADKLSPELQEKLLEFGLLVVRETRTLGQFIDEYSATRSDVKPGTSDIYRVARMNLVEFFGADRELRSITPGDADEFCVWLTQKKYSKAAKGYAAATISRRKKLAKQFFTAAHRKHLVPSNPFADVKAGAQNNRSRDFFVTRATITKVLAACPDAEWRAAFACSRYGGMRVPSEFACLKWDDIDWERKRIHVHSPKTEHHEGKDSRVIPLFPELEPYLSALWDQAEEGEVYVSRRYNRMRGRANLITHARRIIKKAGFKPWPKTFHNMRASRETELAQEYPLHVVTEWIGNSTLIAAKHYLQVTDDDFEKATERAASALHQRRTTSTKEKTGGGGKRKKPRENRGNGARCHSLTDVQAGPQGFEQLADSPMETDESAERAANALHSDADLERIIAAWPTLPVDVRQDLAHLVERFAEME